MKLHEYQAKERFRAVGLTVPRGVVVKEASAAAEAFASLGTPVVVVKAQIHAGGRGKAGGVKLVRSADEARQVAETLLGHPLVTKQTGREGRSSARCSSRRASTSIGSSTPRSSLDRRLESPVVMASAEGGVEIEEVAARRPKAILREVVDPLRGLARIQGAAARVSPQGARRARPAAGDHAPAPRAALASRATRRLVEVNPLVTTKDGRVVCLDGKMSIDDNALFRQKELAAVRDPSEEEPTRGSGAATPASRT